MVRCTRYQSGSAQLIGSSRHVAGAITLTGTHNILQGSAQLALLTGTPYIEDVDGPGTLVGATVSISGTASSHFEAGDVLAANTQGLR